MESCNLELNSTNRLIAKGLCIGLSNQEIAEKLKLTVSRVKRGVAELTHRFNVANRTALAGYLMHENVVEVKANDFHAYAMNIGTSLLLVMSLASNLTNFEYQELQNTNRSQQRHHSVRITRRESTYA